MVTMIERPIHSGVYPVGEAVALIQATSSILSQHREDITTRHLFRWVRDGLTGNYLTKLRGEEVALTFLDLVSLRMIALFRAHGVTSQEIREAHQKLQIARRWSHPFAMEPLWVSGLHIFVRKNNIPLAITKNWQAAFDFLELFSGPMHNMLFGNNEIPTIWEPQPGIVLDPKISFGEPCLKGTRIATQVLWSLVEAGDPPDRVAMAYQLPVEQVEAAIAWEHKLAA